MAKDVRRANRRKFDAEENIRIVIEGFAATPHHARSIAS